MTAHVAEIAPDLDRSVEGRRTPEQVLKSIVDGINSGNLDSLMSLYEPGAAFATQPGSLSHGLPGVRQALAGQTRETGGKIRGRAAPPGRRLMALRDRQPLGNGLTE